MRSKIKNRNLQLGANSVIYKLIKDKKIYSLIQNLAIEISKKINKQYGFNINGQGYDFVFIWNKNSNLDELSYKIIYKDILNTFKYIKNKSENEAKPEK